jgi:hypothetical protein
LRLCKARKLSQVFLSNGLRVLFVWQASVYTGIYSNMFIH